MARTAKSSKIDTRSARAKLAERREPYWTVRARGCAVGYRKGRKGGTWIARWRDDEGKQHYEALGAADDHMEPDGHRVFSFAQAQTKADDWFRMRVRVAAGGTIDAGLYTVADALRDYLDSYRGRGGKDVKSALTKARALILPSLGNIEVARLTALRLRNWHHALAETPARVRTRKGEPQRFQFAPSDDNGRRRRKATANRVLAILKAALNFAYHEHRVDIDDAWRRVKPFAGTNVATIRYIEQAECRRLVSAVDPAFRPVVQAALLTGARYGELVRLTVSDYKRDAKTLLISHSKSGRSRHVALTEEAVALFEVANAGRSGTEIMLPRADGRPWAKDDQTRKLRQACERAGIDPPISFHILRHTYASLLTKGGASLHVIAHNLGHSSTAITEKHYAHLAPSHIAHVIQAAMPKLGIVESMNIAAPSMTRRSND